MEHMDGKSLNIIEENVKKIKNIFPEIYDGEKIDFQKLEYLLGKYKDEGKEKYEFVWPGKNKSIKLAQTQSSGTLRPVYKSSKKWNDTNNIYIEGDNLEVLKLLQKSYNNKIKMIYIDPPYNTGNDIIYKNNYYDSIDTYLRYTKQINTDGMVFSTNTQSNGRYHSDWLSMMYSRLRLARNLLTEDGAIVIAIDHNELANLIKISDEIFGETNRIGIVTVVHKPEGRNQEKYFATSNEFALFYCKNKDIFNFNSVILDDELLKNYDREDSKGRYKLNNYIRLGGGDDNLRKNKPNFYYPIYVSKDLKTISLQKKDMYYEIYPNTKTQERTWKTKSDTFLNRLESGEILAEKNKDGEVQIYEKYRVDKGQLIKTHWIDKKYNSINGGTKVLYDLMDGKTFDFPKSVYLLIDIIKLISDKDSIILDLFSGSSTTAHATMKLNAQDGGTRKFIMVQLPEKINEKSEAYKLGYTNICEIAKERIRRAGDKIKEENKDKEGIEDLDIGFKVFKLDSSNIKRWDSSYEQDLEENLFSSVDNIKEGRTEEDILYEILLKYGVDLNAPVEEHDIAEKKVFDIGFGAIIACLDKNITLDVVEGIGKLKEKLNPETCRVVFMDNGFSSDSVKTNAVQILKRFNIEDVKSI